MDRTRHDDTSEHFATGRGYAAIAAANARAAAIRFARSGATARAERLAELAAKLDELAEPELDAGAVPSARAAR